MSLYIRMGLYFVFAAIAGQGVGVYDAEAGTLTLSVDALEPIVGGVLGYIGTFAASRVAKAKGGAT